MFNKDIYVGLILFIFSLPCEAYTHTSKFPSNGEVSWILLFTFRITAHVKCHVSKHISLFVYGFYFDVSGVIVGGVNNKQKSITQTLKSTNDTF